jgi:hypothetical protein
MIVLEYVFNKKSTTSFVCNISEKKANIENDVKVSKITNAMKNNTLMIGFFKMPKLNIFRTKNVLYK